MERIREVTAAGVVTQALVDLCDDQNSGLSSQDNDWLRAGMELGLFRDAVLFGVQHDGGLEFPLEFDDHRGNCHRIESLPRPNDCIGYQGVLGDAISGLPAPQRVLGWAHRAGVAWFVKRAEKFLLDIDLDCFAISWSDHTFPWPEQVFDAEFLKPSVHWTTRGKTGRDFFRALMEGAGIVTIATEPGCCGDRNGDGPNVHQILSSLDRCCFDGKLLPDTGRTLDCARRTSPVAAPRNLQSA
jgi:hypothetical protein